MSEEKAARKLVQASRKHGLSAISQAAKLLIEARRTRRPAATAGVALKSDADAYRVQDAVFAELWPETRPAAWKAGGPSDKVEPTAAPVAREAVLASPGSVSASKMHMLGVEAEIAFRLAKGLPLRARPYSERAVAAAVGEALVAIEICDTRLADWKSASGVWKIADFMSNFALVVGSGTRGWREIDFSAQKVEFAIGAQLMRAQGAHSFGNPFRVLPWLVRHCAARGLALHAGDVITTGAWTGLCFARPGDTVVARFPGIGEATARFEP